MVNHCTEQKTMILYELCLALLMTIMVYFWQNGLLFYNNVMCTNTIHNISLLTWENIEGILYGYLRRVLGNFWGGEEGGVVQLYT